jgi:uncharacterized protein (TIGR02118 family)
MNFDWCSWVFKLVILLRKKVGWSDDGFAKYWLETHAPLASRMPRIRRYVVNIVRRPPNREPDYHGVVELWFDDVAAMKKAFASPEGQATSKDTEVFTDSVTVLYIDEHPIM